MPSTLFKGGTDRHRFFPVNFTKFHRTPFLQNASERLPPKFFLVTVHVENSKISFQHHFILGADISSPPVISLVLLTSSKPVHWPSHMISLHGTLNQVEQPTHSLRTHNEHFCWLTQGSSCFAGIDMLAWWRGFPVNFAKFKKQ